MKKRLLSVVCLTLILTLAGGIKESKAIDFEGQESKYMKLCSSSSLSQNESTCREFNNTKGAKISEFSALEFEDFLKIPQTIDKRNTDDKNRKVISVKDLVEEVLNHKTNLAAP